AVAEQTREIRFSAAVASGLMRGLCSGGFAMSAQLGVVRDLYTVKHRTAPAVLFAAFALTAACGDTTPDHHEPPGGCVGSKDNGGAAIEVVSSALTTQGHIKVDVTAGHATNSISPLRAMGAGIDRDPVDSLPKVFQSPDLDAMLSSGWGSVSYRLNTELGVQ